MIYNQAFFNDLIASPLATSGNIGSMLLHSVGIPPNGSIAALLAAPGVQEVTGYGYTAGGYTTNYNLTDVAGPPVITEMRSAGQFQWTTTSPVYVEGIVFYWVGTKNTVVNPWFAIMPINAMWTPGSFIKTPPKAANPPSDPGGDPAGTRLISYLKVTPTAEKTWYATIISYGVDAWSPARVNRVYLYPQRINWAVNPTFRGTLFGWRASAALTRQVENSQGYGSMAAAGEIQSLPVPIPNTMTTIRAKVRSKGATTIRADIVMYDEAATVSRNPSNTVTLPTGGTAGWVSLLFFVPVADDTVRAGLAFVANGSIDIDDVMWSTGYADYPYFDGDSLHSFVEDFSWNGVPHESLALWYNNRAVVRERLFGDNGLVKQWLPEGQRFEPVFDVLSPTDTKHPLKDWAARTIP